MRSSGNHMSSEAIGGHQRPFARQLRVNDEPPHIPHSLGPHGHCTCSRRLTEGASPSWPIIDNKSRPTCSSLAFWYFCARTLETAEKHTQVKNARAAHRGHDRVRCRSVPPSTVIRVCCARAAVSALVSALYEVKQTIVELGTWHLPRNAFFGPTSVHRRHARGSIWWACAA